MSFMTIKTWLAAMLVMALVGCGGGGASGSAVLGGGGGAGGSATAAKVDVRSSNTTLGDGDSTVTLTAVVKDANDAAIAKAPVTWAFTAGKLAEVTATTDVSGTATATFSAIDRSAVTATVTVTSGTAKGSVVIALQAARTVSVDSPAKTLGVAIDGQTATVTATVKDPGNVAISGASVSWRTDVGTLRSISSVTNASGQATAIFDAGSTLPPGASPKATITVTSAGASGSVQIPINAVSKSIELLADATSIGTGGDTTTLRAFVKNGVTNAALPGQTVNWSASSGTLAIISSTTDSSGVATAVLSAGSDKTNREAVVTASSDSASQTLRMPIIRTTLSISGATSTSLGSTVVLNLSGFDSKGVPIPRITLSLTSTLGNTLPATVLTDAAGQASISYTAINVGADTISVSGAGATASALMTVSGTDENLSFVSPKSGSTVDVGKDQPLTLRYLKNGAAQSDKELNLAATIGILSGSLVKTDARGEATVKIISPFAGTSTVTATLTGGTVQATLKVSFVATTPAMLVLQASPSALAPNTAGGTAQWAAVFAKVTDATGNPVPGVVVNFSQQADPSHGVLSQASSSTDVNGVATVQYFSGADSTASGAVVLKATAVNKPLVPPDPNPSKEVSGTTALTVNGEALFIVLGTGNTISNFDAQTYEKNWTVYVTDANGVQVANKKVTVKVIPTYYFKGYLVWSDLASQWINAIPPLACANEDVNANGRLEAGEDINGDGTLTPGNVVSISLSTVTTDSNGAATITMRYAELYAPWISVRLTAAATVGGTESTTFKDFPLDKLASDFSVKTVSPAGVISPFGIDTSTCTNPR